MCEEITWGSIRVDCVRADPNRENVDCGGRVSLSSGVARRSLITVFTTSTQASVDDEDADEADACPCALVAVEGPSL